jgi:hypothetical protein
MKTGQIDVLDKSFLPLSPTCEKQKYPYVI